MPQHFLDLAPIAKPELRRIIDQARTWKAGHDDLPLKGKALAMIFEKSSTRTRVSFERAIQQLGGEAIILSSADMQMGRGETIADTARVLSRYCDAIMIRTFGAATLNELAEHATVPVINGLTDRSHPCQVMADVLTYEEHRGAIAGKQLAYVGDGNNMAHSLMEAAERFDFNLSIGTPQELQPDPFFMNSRVTLTQTAEDAVTGASAVIADTWISMGDADAENRHNLLKPYQVNDSLMRKADENAIFMHCLPAHREEEVTASVIDGPQSVVFDEAENRLHAQKAILAWCMGAI